MLPSDKTRPVSAATSLIMITMVMAMAYPGLTSAEATTTFVNITAAAGLAHQHTTTQTILRTEDICECMDEVEILSAHAEILSSWITGGVAAGDYDDDGFPDLYVIGGNAGANRLFRNLGDKTFADVTNSAGVGVSGERSAGAVFVDFDGDHDLDLFIGGAVGTAPRLFRSERDLQGEVTFTNIWPTAFAAFDPTKAPNTWGGAFGDFDQDGDLDLFMPHSVMPQGPVFNAALSPSTQHLWRNQGDGTFSDVSIEAGISALFGRETQAGESFRDLTFSPNFVDLNEDGCLDLVIAGDIGTSRVLLNQCDGTFSNATDPTVITGRTAMGTAVADFDHDGHFDWFISHVRFPDSTSGNRLYRGRGDGTFENVTASAGVRNGHWGWGSCFADFDNDGHPDIFHVNGFFHVPINPFTFDGNYTGTTAVLFKSNGDGSFTQSAAEMQLSDGGEGRGVSCFDFDRDGDVDIAISNHRGAFKLWENQAGDTNGFLNVKLIGRAPNTAGISARIRLRSSGVGALPPQMHLVRAGSNFVSSDPAEAHFGLAGEPGPFAVEVHWPNGQIAELETVAGNQFLEVTQTRLDLVSEPVFDEEEIGVLQAVAQDVLGQDISGQISWSLGSRENIVGAGSSLDLAPFDLTFGRHTLFLELESGSQISVLPFELVVTSRCVTTCRLFADDFETGNTSIWSTEAR